MTRPSAIETVKANRRAQLNALLDAMGKTELGRRLGMNPDYLFQMGRGAGKSQRPVSDKVAAAIEVLMGWEPGAMDQPISMQPPIVSAVAETATRADYVRVEQLDGEADMGDGRVNDDYPEVIRSVDYTREYIRGLVGFVPPPGRLVLVTGRGDSMIPTIQPGESLLVDTGINSFDGDGIYLVNLGSGQQFKRLVDHGGDEGVYVHSDNESIRAYSPRRLHADAVIGGKVYLRNRIDRFN